MVKLFGKVHLYMVVSRHSFYILIILSDIIVVQSAIAIVAVTCATHATRFVINVKSHMVPAFDSHKMHE